MACGLDPCLFTSGMISKSEGPEMTHAVLLTELKRRFQLQHTDKGQDKETVLDKEKEIDRNRQVAVHAQSNLPVKSEGAQSNLPVKSEGAQSNLLVIDFLRPVTVHANWMVGTDDKVG